MEEKYSISETARLLNIHRTTLHRWIRTGVVPRPIEETTAGVQLRYWLRDGFSKVEQYKREHFREGQGKRNRLKRQKRK
jgi:hypothetical protein